ncbi:hypothetical protein [Burkholderia ambifaria]|uniref:hypothetical protein n=1 Tax=Burkholderia ambifaria TaxID=152480 RepID=UPI00158DCA76|nr:hypothetical protein [Burkholderia ambifaria]
MSERLALAWEHRVVVGLSCTAFVALLVAVVAITTSGSEWRCGLRAKRYGTVSNSIQRYVIVGYGDKPACPLPGEAPAYEVKIGQPITVWVRSIYYDNVTMPASDTAVTLELVNAFGKAVAAQPPDFMLNPTSISTNASVAKGFYGGSIVFVAQKPDVYRIKASYKDRELDAYSLGPLIIVH